MDSKLRMFGINTKTIIITSSQMQIMLQAVAYGRQLELEPEARLVVILKLSIPKMILIRVHTVGTVRTEQPREISLQN